MLHNYLKQIEELNLNIHREFSDFLRPFCKPYHISDIQYQTLHHIYEHDCCTVGECAKALKQDAGNMSSLCKKLENAGFIKRHKNRHDERVVELQMQDKGKHCMEDILEKTHQHYEKQWTQYNEDDKELILKGLTKLNQFIKIATKKEGKYMNKKAILFDLDGTLINTYENINFRQALSELKTVQKTLIIKIIKSRVKSFADLERRIRDEVEDPKEAQELINRISEFLLQHYDNAPLKNEALTFLYYLKQKGYKICLCTNNATDVVNHILEKKQIKEYFDYVVTSQQVSKSKPDPQMYLEALKFVQLDASECIVFEDTESGVQAARTAGIDVIVVCEKEKRKFADCPMIITDFSDERLYKIL